MSWTDAQVYALHTTYLLIACSYVVRDILWLRGLAVTASCFSVAANYGIQLGALPETRAKLWIIISWNVVFLMINAVWIGRLLRERWAARFDELETELWETVFSALSPVEFLKLMRVGAWSELGEGTAIASEGEELEHLVLVYSGRCAVTVAGRQRAVIGDGDFIGEMSFTTSGPASATVVTTQPTRVVRWRKDELREVLDRNPGLKNSIQGVLGVDMAKKLATRRIRPEDLSR